MKALIAILIMGFLLLSQAGCARDEAETPSPEPTVIEDIAQAASDKATVLFENEYLVLTEFSLSPGDELPLHKGGRRAVYSLSDYTIAYTEDGADATTTLSADDAHFHEAKSHAVKNVGETETRYLVVTCKEAELPEDAGYALEQDVNQATPGKTTILLDNDDV